MNRSSTWLPASELLQTGSRSGTVNWINTLTVNLLPLTRLGLDSIYATVTFAFNLSFVWWWLMAQCSNMQFYHQEQSVRGMFRLDGNIKTQRGQWLFFPGYWWNNGPSHWFWLRETVMAGFSSSVGWVLIPVLVSFHPCKALFLMKFLFIDFAFCSVDSSSCFTLAVGFLWYFAPDCFPLSPVSDSPSVSNQLSAHKQPPHLFVCLLTCPPVTAAFS